MWALLRTTIEEQAASGAFDSVGMVESVELVNSNETDSTTDGDSEGGGGLGTGAIAGIPSAVGGIVAIAIAGFVIYKMLGSDKDDENNGNDQNDAVNNSDGIVEAQAVVMDDEGQNEKDCVWQKSKNQFL